VGFFYGYVGKGVVQPWAFRPYLRGLLISLGTLSIAGILPVDFGRRAVLTLAAHAMQFGSRKTAGIVALGALLGSAVLARGVLEGIPHTNDGPTYLLQGRLLMQGKLAVEPPTHPELFDPMRLKFRTAKNGFAGQYTVGWPAVLGLFDWAGVRWLANPVLLAGTVLLLYRFVSRQLNSRIALFSVIFFAVSPFVLLSAAEQLSHVAATFFLMVFINCLWESLADGQLGKATLAGVGMSAALACRPADAVFCSLAMAPLVLIEIVRGPAKIWRLLPVVVGAVPGIAALLAINAATTGAGTKTMYSTGDSDVSPLFRQTPENLLSALSWFHENLVGLGLYGFLGAIPAIAVAAFALVTCRRQLSCVRPLIALGIGTLLGYSVFVFLENPFFGPRWLYPAMPMLAVAIGIVTQSAVVESGKDRPGSTFYGLLLNWLVVAFIALLIAILPARALELLRYPPNRVDGRVWEAVQAQGIHQAVVALPRDEGVRSVDFCKDPRAGFWTMTLPFERNDVIFVTESPGWTELARESFPNRQLYRMKYDPADYRVYPADGPDSDRAAAPLPDQP